MSAADQVKAEEVLLAEIGVRPFIYRELTTITLEQMRKIAKIPDDLERLAKGLCQGDLKGAAISDLPYDRTLRLLYEEFAHDELEQFHKAFEKNAADMEAPVMAKVGEIIKFLGGIFPRKSFDVLEGQEQIEPDAYEICTFTAILDVLDDPLTVFRGMSNASILSAQVAAVRQFYPTLAEAIDEVTASAPIDARAAKASFRLDWNTEIGINKWLGNLPIDPELAAMLLEVQAMSPMNVPPPPPRAPKANPEQQVKGALSDADRAALPVSAAVK